MLYVTGDTAQSIMRGISFRFSDLKSLFYHAKQSMIAMGKTSAVEVPKTVKFFNSVLKMIIISADTTAYVFISLSGNSCNSISM